MSPRENFKELYESDCKRKFSDISLQSFKKLKNIDSGAFSQVILVRNCEIDEKFAMKIMQKKMIIQLGQVDHVIDEKKIMESIEFPFIVHLENSFKKR